jgi:hypothetical protein
LGFLGFLLGFVQKQMPRKKRAAPLGSENVLAPSSCAKVDSASLVKAAFERKLRVLALLKEDCPDAVSFSKTESMAQTVALAQAKPFQANDSLAASLRKEHDKLSQLSSFLLQQDQPNELEQLGRKPSDDRHQRLRNAQSKLFDLHGQTTEDFFEFNTDLLFNANTNKRRMLTMARAPKQALVELTNINQRLQVVKQTLHCHEQNGNTGALALQQQDFYVANDICERCFVPYISLAKESRVVCPKCSRPKTAYLLGTLQSGGLGETLENDSAKASERKKSYRAFLQQFREGTRVPPAVLLGVENYFVQTLHMRSNNNYKIGRVKEALEALHLSDWEPYVLRITLQLMRMPMPSLMNNEIDVMVDLYDFLHARHQEECTGEAFPNAKRVTEMILICMQKPSFARCFITARTPTKRAQFVVFDNMIKLLKKASKKLQKKFLN